VHGFLVEAREHWEGAYLFCIISSIAAGCNNVGGHSIMTKILRQGCTDWLRTDSFHIFFVLISVIVIVLAYIHSAASFNTLTHLSYDTEPLTVKCAKIVFICRPKHFKYKINFIAPIDNIVWRISNYTLERGVGESYLPLEQVHNNWNCISWLNFIPSYNISRILWTEEKYFTSFSHFVSPSPVLLLFLFS
jgi:hypothetical protein